MQLGGDERRQEATGGGGTWSANRGQSVVIGTILVFAIVVTVYGLFQATVIPSANADVEADHSQETRAQLLDLRNDFRRSANTGQSLSQGLTLGVDYPTRTFFLTPGSPAGTIETRGTTDSDVEFIVDNATAVDGETADYWDGSEQQFDTGAIVYNPSYNFYEEAPEVVAIENSIVYSEYEETTLLESNQQIVNGREISLTALDGDLSRSQSERFIVDTQPASAATRTVSVESSSEPIRIQIPTRLSEETLVEDVFYSEIDDDGGPPTDTDGDGIITCDEIDSDSSSPGRYIQNCGYESDASSEFNTFKIYLEPETTYNLQLSNISVGTGGAETGPYYITKVSGSTSALEDTGEREFVYEVRDRYNNPVSGVEIPIEATDGGTFTGGVTTTTETTNENGRVSVTFIADGVPDDSSTGATVKAGGDLDFDGDGDPDFDPDGSGTAEPREGVTTSFTVVDSLDDSDVSVSVNPSDPIRLVRANTSGVVPGSTPRCEDSDDQCYVAIELENTGSEDYQFAKLRYQYYIAPEAPGAGGREAPAESVEIDAVSGGPPCGSETFEFQDSLNDGDATDLGTIPEDETRTLILDFNTETGEFKSVRGDGFIISAKYESTESDNVVTLTYFVSVREDTDLENPCPGAGGGS